MSKTSSSSIAAIRIFAAAIAGVLCFHAPAFAADSDFDPMQSWNGPVASAPSQGAREVLRDVERGPSLTQRFNLPPLSGLLPLELPNAQIFRDRGQLASPPFPEIAERVPRRAR